MQNYRKRRRRYSNEREFVEYHKSDKIAYRKKHSSRGDLRRLQASWHKIKKHHQLMLFIKGLWWSLPFILRQNWKMR